MICGLDTTLWAGLALVDVNIPWIQSQKSSPKLHDHVVPSKSRKDCNTCSHRTRAKITSVDITGIPCRHYYYPPTIPNYLGYFWKINPSGLCAIKIELSPWFICCCLYFSLPSDPSSSPSPSPSPSIPASTSTPSPLTPLPSTLISSQHRDPSTRLWDEI